jgi:hypothetical protein
MVTIEEMRNAAAAAQDSSTECVRQAHAAVDKGDAPNAHSAMRSAEAMQLIIAVWTVGVAVCERLDGLLEYELQDREDAWDA